MILVLDNYDSFTYNLVHLVARDAEVRVVRNDAVTVADVMEMAPAGILLSPGPGRPSEAGIMEALIKALGPRVPILGVCLGHQAIGEVYGGTVKHAPTLMHGKTSAIRHDGKTIFEGIPQDFIATRYHSGRRCPSRSKSPPSPPTASSWDSGTAGCPSKAYSFTRRASSPARGRH